MLVFWGRFTRQLQFGWGSALSAIINRLMPSASTAHLFAVVALAGTFIWIGLIDLANAPTGIKGWVEGHPYGQSVSLYLSKMAIAVAITQIIAGGLIAVYAVPQRLKRLSYGVLAAFGLISTSLILTNDVWIKSLGGFPAIGSGQGLLKYIAVTGVCLWFLNKRWANEVMLLGIILVLLWIGAMKFTGPEADGVWPLLTSSPLFNFWITDFGKQMASNIVGVIELLTVLLLTGRWWNRKAYELGLAVAAITFITTLSFLVTFAPSWSGGFPNLSGTGIFLVKDTILLAAVFILYRD